MCLCVLHTCSMQWGTILLQRRARWLHTPWQRPAESSASSDPPEWWRYLSGSGTSYACYRASHYSGRSSPHSAASYACCALEKNTGKLEGVKKDTKSRQTPSLSSLPQSIFKKNGQEVKLSETHPKSKKRLNW